MMLFSCWRRRLSITTQHQKEIERRTVHLAGGTRAGLYRNTKITMHPRYLHACKLCTTLSFTQQRCVARLTPIKGL